MADNEPEIEPAPHEERSGHYADLLNQTVWDTVVEDDRNREAQDREGGDR